MSVEVLARPLAGGREAEILDLGDGTVLRRYRGVGFPEREGLVMEHARRHGYPVPRVVEIREDALVLERIDGLTMARDALTRPWRARAHMRLLAELHQRLHGIEAPSDLAAAGPGSTLIHLDFHPENVLLSPNGPVVIDWTNARRGGLVGKAFLPPYLACFDLEPVRRALPDAAARRIDDRNVTDRERAAVRRLVERERR